MQWGNREPQWGGGWGGSSGLDEVLMRLRSFFRGGGLRRSPGKALGGFVIVLLALIFLFSGLYTVGPEEMGVVQRFGRYVRTAPPGLHFKIPFGVETVQKVKTARVFKEEFGFRTVKAGRRTQYAKRGYTDESLMLTGDLNVIDVEWIVQYRIKDPVQWLFRVRDVDSTIRDISEAVMRRVVGNRIGLDVLTVGREEIAEFAHKELQEILDTYETGVDIVTVKLQDVNPPEPVQAAFNEVNEARQDRERMINEAQEAYNKEVPKAKGEAARTIQGAEGYALERVNRAKGEANRFLAVLREYNRAKDVTRRRLYLEAFGQILPKTKEVYIIDGDQRAILPFLEIGKRELKGGGQ